MNDSVKELGFPSLQTPMNIIPKEYFSLNSRIDLKYNPLLNNPNSIYDWRNRVHFDDFADKYLTGLLYNICHGDSTLRDWPETRDTVKRMVQSYSDEFRKMNGYLGLSHILSCCHLNNEALEALAYSERFCDKVLESHDSPMYLRMYLLAGDLNGRIGDYQKAQESLDTAKRIWKKRRDKDNRALSWLLANQGHLHLYQQEYHEAENLYNRSLYVRGKLEDPRLSALISYNMADLSFQQEKYDRCQEYLKQADIYSNKFSDTFYLAGMIKCKWAEVFSREEYNFSWGPDVVKIYEEGTSLMDARLPLSNSLSVQYKNKQGSLDESNIFRHIDLSSISIIQDSMSSSGEIASLLIEIDKNETISKMGNWLSDQNITENRIDLLSSGVPDEETLTFNSGISLLLNQNFNIAHKSVLEDTIGSNFLGNANITPVTSNTSRGLIENSVEEAVLREIEPNRNMNENRIVLASRNNLGQYGAKKIRIFKVHEKQKDLKQTKSQAKRLLDNPKKGKDKKAKFQVGTFLHEPKGGKKNMNKA